MIIQILKIKTYPPPTRSDLPEADSYPGQFTRVPL